METYLRMQQHCSSPWNITRSSRIKVTLNHVFKALMWTWRRLMMANAHQAQDGVPPEVNDATKNERTLIACAAQIVAEKTAKQGNRANEAKLETAQEDSCTVLVRKELADLRNTQN